MLRRLYHEQPEDFAFTPENRKWAEAQITKYPEGRQASAVIPLLWRAQEQEGWISRPVIEEVARMLDMASIRVLEVAILLFHVPSAARRQRGPCTGLRDHLVHDLRRRGSDRRLP